MIEPCIVMIGAPGSGKSTVGDALGRALGEPFTDIDTLIEAKEGTSIADLFVTRGEPAFRALEAAETIEALQRSGIVALGGGAIHNEQIRAALVGHHVVWLECSVSTAVDRIGLNSARPLLLGNVRGTLIKLLAERTPLYRGAATITVATDGRNADEVVELVRAELGR
ncbi:shikimate kinase [Naumannella sp. ID2617S]|nr:shikimate kinase [Naumannella sp. ID2617S]